MKAVQTDQVRATAGQNLGVQHPNGVLHGDAVLAGDTNLQIHGHLRVGYLELGDHLPQVFILIQAVDVQFGIRRCGGVLVVNVVVQGAFPILVAQHIEAAVLRPGQSLRIEGRVTQGGSGPADQLLSDAASGNIAIEAVMGGEEQVAIGIFPEGNLGLASLGGLQGRHDLFSQNAGEGFRHAVPADAAASPAQQIRILTGTEESKQGGFQLIEIAAQLPGFQIHLPNLFQIELYQKPSVGGKIAGGYEESHLRIHIGVGNRDFPAFPGGIQEPEVGLVGIVFHFLKGAAKHASIRGQGNGSDASTFRDGSGQRKGIPCITLGTRSANQGIPVCFHEGDPQATGGEHDHVHGVVAVWQRNALLHIPPCGIDIAGLGNLHRRQFRVFPAAGKAAQQHNQGQHQADDSFFVYHVFFLLIEDSRSIKLQSLRGL